MTPEELAANLIPYNCAKLMVDTPGGDRKVYDPSEWRDDVIAAIRAAVAERDMEWWEACALVDNVAPEPQAVKRFITQVEEYDIGIAIAEEREACAKVAEEHELVTRDEDLPLGVNKSLVYVDGTGAEDVPERIAAAIRAREA